MFDESFDLDAPGGGRGKADEDDLLPEAEPEPEPEPPPPPTFNEAELAAARQEGFAEGEKAGHGAGYGKGFTEGLTAGRNDGLEAGRKEAERTIEARIAGALEQAAGGVAQLLAERNATNVMRCDQPVHIALAIVRKLMPELARSQGLGEIEGLVRACLAELIDEPRLVVRVGKDVLEPVRERLDRVSAEAGFGARLMVVAEPSIGPGDCRIEWAEGGVERDTVRLLADIEQIAARLLEAPAPA